MSKTKYRINSTWIGQYEEEIYFNGTIEIEDEVIKSVDDEWRNTFYPSLNTPQKVAEHIACNIIVNDLTLSQLDGFANFPDDFAKIIV
jgi:hypothetical protein